MVSVKVYDAINVKIKTDGKITNEDGDNYFLLHVGMLCKTIPERHSSLIYEMLGISKGNVIFKYTSIILNSAVDALNSK